MGTAFTEFLHGTLGSPPLVFVAIVLATFVLEDPATVAAALAASDGLVTPGLCLVALWVGVAVGDIGLYGLGALAARSPLGRRWLDPVRTETARARLRGRTASVLIGARFVPGLRLPTYTAAGAIGVPLSGFVLAIVIGTLIWTTLLFGLVFMLGRSLGDALGPWRWAFGAVLVLMVWAIERGLARAGPAAPGAGRG